MKYTSSIIMFTNCSDFFVLLSLPQIVVSCRSQSVPLKQCSNSLPINLRPNFKVLTVVYKTIHGMPPTDPFPFCHPSHSTLVILASAVHGKIILAFVSKHLDLLCHRTFSSRYMCGFL